MADLVICLPQYMFLHKVWVHITFTMPVYWSVHSNVTALFQMIIVHVFTGCWHMHRDGPVQASTDQSTNIHL
jgi:hypothetical protein